MFKGEILDLIYPPKCGICGKISKDFLCAKCVILLEKQAIFEIEDTRNQKKTSMNFYMFLNMKAQLDKIY